MSDQIRAVLEHYKGADPIGIPGDYVPDPMPIPPIKHTISMFTLKMFNLSLHGLSQFRIETVFTNIAEMEFQAALRIDELQLRGNYTLGTWLSRSQGGCTVTLTEVYVQCLSMMEVARYGNLEAADIKLDINVNNIKLDFQNLGFLASTVQGMMNTLGNFVFDSIKPFIMAEMNSKIRGRLNTDMRNMKQTFPNSIPPIDLAVAEVRKYVRKKGYDPYKLQDYTQSVGVFGFYVTNTELTGISSFYRVGNVTVSVHNNIVQLGFNIGTKQLEGQCKWEASAAGMLSHLGSTCFSIEYIQVQAKIDQALNTRKHPELVDLQLKMGNIQLRSDGTGTLDYILEAVVNILPNLLRYQIMDAIEEPLRQKIQETLDTINVEKVIEDKLPDIDKLATGVDFDNINSNITSSDIEQVTSTTTNPIEGLVVDESQLDQEL